MANYNSTAQLPEIVHYPLIAANTLFALFGMVGNVVASHVFLRGKKTHTQQNLLLFNIAIADLGVLIISFPVWAVHWAHNNWPFGYLLCRILPTISNAFQSVCIFSMIALAILRYRTIVHTLDGQISFLNVKLVMALIWLISFAVVGPPVITTQELKTSSKTLNTTVGNHSTIYVTTHTSCRPVWSNRLNEQLHKSYDILLGYVIPLALIYLLFLRVRRFINKQINEDVLRASTRAARVYSNRLLHMKKALRMLIVVFSLYAFLLLPWHFFILATIIFPSKTIRHRDIYEIVSKTLLILNSAIKPIIYYFMWVEFRSETRKIFRKCKPRNTEDVVDTPCSQGNEDGIQSSDQKKTVVSLRRVDSLDWSALKESTHEVTLKRNAYIISSCDLGVDYQIMLPSLDDKTLKETNL